MNTKGKQRLMRLLLILGMFSGLCLFLAGALRENIVFFKTPSELVKLGSFNNRIRLGGMVVVGSIKTAEGVHIFKITDQIHTIDVKFKGRFPDLFREGQGVVALGTYDTKQNVFEAQQLLAKHDQYYRPPQNYSR